MAVVAGLTAMAAAGLVTTTPSNAAPMVAASRLAAQQAGSFHPIDSTRVLDTRRSGGVASAGVARFGVSGHGAIPVGAAAVTVNVTVLSPVRSGSISVFPGNTAWNGAASISFVAGQTKQSMTTAVLGSDGSLAVRNNTGAALQVIADVNGYYAGGSPTAPGSFKAIGFQRILDTRSPGFHALPPGAVWTLPPWGPGQQPYPAAAAVANLTVISPARSGSVSVYAGNTTWDGSSSVSFPAGSTEQDVLTIPVTTNWGYAIRNNTTVALQVVLDLIGYFLDGTSADYGSYQSASPVRVLDERRAGQPPVQPGRTVAVPSSSVSGSIPAWGLPAAVVRFTILAPARAGSISVFRADRAWNGAASISFPAGRTTQQQLITPLGPNQQLVLRNNTGSPLTVVADVLGYYRGVPSPLHQASSSPFEPGPAQLQGVSCATATFCMATEQSGKAEFWNGSSWSAPLHAPQADSLGSVSCVSASFCMATGLADKNSHIELFRFDGSSWTALASMVWDASMPPAVSCASTTFCLATGNGTYRTFDGTSWSAEQTLPTSFRPYLSCPSPTFCLMVDSGSHVYTFDGTSWTGPTGSVGTFGPRSVSCTSPSFCVAVSSDGKAATYDGTSWAVTGKLAGSPLLSVSCASSSNCRAVISGGLIIAFDGQSWSAPVDLGFPVAAVSCAAAGNCVAIAPGPASQAASFDGTGWSRTPQVAAQPQGAVAVSCTSASFCMAADAAGYVVRYDGTGWDAPVMINGRTGRLTGLSCATSANCIAVDDQGRAYRYDGTSWAAPVTVAAGTGLDAVSCASASFCVAVDFAGRAASFDGSVWSTPVTLGIDPLVGVSCPSSTFCAAVGSTGHAATYTGGQWSASRPTGAGFLDGISCTDASFCLATGLGEAARWQNGSWTSVGIPAGHFLGLLSCPNSQQCVAATPRLYSGSGYLPGQGTVVTWDGTEWTMPLSLAASAALSCPSTSFCMVLADYSAYQLTG